MNPTLSIGSEAARRSKFVVYADTSPAFHADDRPTYRKDVAEVGGKRCTAWLQARAHGLA